MRSGPRGMSVKRSEATSTPATDPLTMSASTSTINHLNRPILEQIMFERRILFGCTVMLGIVTIIWIVAISTDHWFHVYGEDGIYMNHTGRYFLSSHSGIWRLCRTVLIPPKHHQHPSAAATNAKNTTAPDLTDPSFRATERNYSRTEASFAIISLFLMCMGVSFSIYTFRNPRYTFKRLAAGCQAITAVSVLAVIEVLCSSIEYERTYLHFTYPPEASDSYGFSMYLAWIVFLMHMISAVAFLMYSKKRKGSKAGNEEMGMADEQINIGR